MMSLKSVVLTVLWGLFASVLNGAEAAIVDENGQPFYLDVQSHHTLAQIVETAQGFGPSHVVINLKDYELKKHGQILPQPRQYHREVNQTERNDIQYILKTLANNSLFSIAVNRSNLESAGDRIDHLHPLRFLMTVFTDEELKVCIRNIRTRGWIWNDFLAGIRESLITEASIGNMKPEFIKHFSNTIELDAQHVHVPVQNNNWDELIETLINKVPRKGDHERYDS